MIELEEFQKIGTRYRGEYENPIEVRNVRVPDVAPGCFAARVKVIETSIRLMNCYEPIQQTRTYVDMQKIYPIDITVKQMVIQEAGHFLQHNPTLDYNGKYLFPDDEIAPFLLWNTITEPPYLFIRFSTTTDERGC